MCEHVVYAIVGQILLFSSFPFIWGMEKTFDVSVPDIVAVFIASGLYMFLGWGIAKVMSGARS